MDSSLEAQLQALSDGLDRGPFIENLQALTDVAKEIVMRSSGPVLLGAFVVETALADLLEAWNSHPISPETYEQVTAELGPSLRRVVHAMIHPEQRLLLQSLLEDLITRLVGLQSSQRVR